MNEGCIIIFMMNKCLFFVLSCLLNFLVVVKPVQAQVYQDYRSDYRKVPVYSKTVQYIFEKNNNNSTIYLRQNLGFSEESTAFVIPFNTKITNIDTILESDDPWNSLLTDYKLPLTYGLKYAMFKIPPQIFTIDQKENFFKLLINENLDISENHRSQVEDWFKNNYSIVLLVVDPVKESRITWTQPIKLQTSSEINDIPLGWLRPEYAKLTSSKGKIIYAQDFESGDGGWTDEYQGPQANSLVTRDESNPYEGSYALKIINKPGSINATSTQTIGGLTPGEHYTFSAYVKNEKGESGDAFLRVMGDGLIALSDDLHLYNPQSHSWQRISLTFQARSAFHFFTMASGGQRQDDYVLWDDVQIEKGLNTSNFNKQAVGQKNALDTNEDITTTNTQIEVLTVSNKQYSITNPQFTTQCFDKLKRIPATFMTTDNNDLCISRGFINPTNFSQFQILSENKTKIKTLPLENRDNSIEQKTTNIIFNHTARYILFIISQFIPLLIVIFKNPKKEEDRYSVFTSVLYQISSIMFTITSLLFLQLIELQNGLLSVTIFSSVFHICFSFAYSISLIKIMKQKTISIYKSSQVVIGILLTIAIVIVSLYLSRLLTNETNNYLPHLIILISILATHLIIMKKFTFSSKS